MPRMPKEALCLFEACACDVCLSRSHESVAGGFYNRSTWAFAASASVCRMGVDWAGSRDFVESLWLSLQDPGGSSLY